MDQLLDDQSLQDVYKELSAPWLFEKAVYGVREVFCPERLIASLRERRGHAGRIRIVRWVAVVAAVWVIVLGR